MSWIEQITARFLVNIGDPAMSSTAKCFFISTLSGILGAVGHVRTLDPHAIVDILIQVSRLQSAMLVLTHFDDSNGTAVWSLLTVLSMQ